jgi:hypothetical protein
MPPHRRRWAFGSCKRALDARITAPIGAQRTICVKSALKCISSVDNAMTRA